MMAIPGLGPKRLRVIHESLGISSIAELEYAIHENRLRDLPGFGMKSQEALRKAVESFRAGRGTLPPAGGVGGRSGLHGHTRRGGDTDRDRRRASPPDGDPLGSPFHRRRWRAGRRIRDGRDQSGRDPGPRSAALERELRRCMALGELQRGASGIAREEGRREGADLTSEGLRRDGALSPLDEAGIYRTLGLEPVHPLLREGPAESGHAYGALAGAESIRGVFHVHTTDSDGTASLPRMVEEAERMGYAWIGISDHSRAATYANGLSAERLRAQRRAIDETQALHPRIRILQGVESDILGDGSLDYEDDTPSRTRFRRRLDPQPDADGPRGDDRSDRACPPPPGDDPLGPSDRPASPRPRSLRLRHGALAARLGRDAACRSSSTRTRSASIWTGAGFPRALELGVKLSVNPDAHSPARARRRAAHDRHRRQGGDLPRTTF